MADRLLQQGFQQVRLGHQPTGLQGSHRFGHGKQSPPLHPHAPALQGAVGQGLQQWPQAHAGQGLQSAGHQGIAAERPAELVAFRRLDQGHRLAGTGQLQGQAESGWAGPHHDEPVHDVAVALVNPASQPWRSWLQRN